MSLSYGRLKTKTNAQLVHLMGEGELDFTFSPAGGQFHLRGSDESLTPYGGLVAWDHFLERCGIIALLAAHYPLPRTSPNATPVADILRAFSLQLPHRRHALRPWPAAAG